MHYGIDLDDVTVDFVCGLLASYELEFGEHLEVGQDGPWGQTLIEFMRNGTSRLRAAGYRSAWDWLRAREWLWAQFPAVKGAIGGVATLRAAGHYVEAVTTKPDWAEHNVWKWLGKWRVPFNSVTIVPTGDSKTDHTEADVIVDDKLATCMEFVKDGRIGIWFNRYQKGHTVTQRLYEASGWDDVLAVADTIATFD